MSPIPSSPKHTSQISRRPRGRPFISPPPPCLQVRPRSGAGLDPSAWIGGHCSALAVPTGERPFACELNLSGFVGDSPTWIFLNSDVSVAAQAFLGRAHVTDRGCRRACHAVLTACLSLPLSPGPSLGPLACLCPAGSDPLLPPWALALAVDLLGHCPPTPPQLTPPSFSSHCPHRRPPPGACVDQSLFPVRPPASPCPSDLPSMSVFICSPSVFRESRDFVSAAASAASDPRLELSTRCD